tara:strand:+ start:7088 stop:7645 length:558 start_codon:yes stop_codon:yes gene_type:complete
MFVDEIFPTPVWGFDLDFNLSDIEYWCYRQKDDSNGRVISNVGGWQSDDLNEFDDTPLTPLIDWINKEAPHWAKDLGIPCDPKVFNLWVNINPKFSYNSVHVHPEARLSGAFYVRAPKDSGALCFTRDNDYALGTVAPNETRYSSAEWMYEPKENRAIIFPAWVKHHVKANLSEKDRISLAFNLR